MDSRKGEARNLGKMGLPKDRSEDMPAVQKSFSYADQSSLGLLPQEMLCEDSLTNYSCSKSVPGDGEKMNAGDSNTATDKSIFRLPDVPKKRATDVTVTKSGPTPSAKAGIPSYLLAPGKMGLPNLDVTNDALQSFDASAANQSSFAWDKVFEQNAEISLPLGGIDPTLANLSLESGFRVESNPAKDFKIAADVTGGVKTVERVGDETFHRINTDNSFFDGQFSARSTSLGGSTDNSTRDEARFSEFPDADKLVNPIDLEIDKTSRQDDQGQSKVGDNPEIHDDSSLLSGPADFNGMTQDFGDLLSETFHSSGGKEFMDAEEERFREEHKLEAPAHINDSVFSLMSSSASKFPDNPTDKTFYFHQNTSRLGSLDGSTISERTRPHLGLGSIESPKRRAKSTGNEKKSSSNTTFTISASEKPTESKGTSDHVTNLLKQGSSDKDPQYFSETQGKVSDDLMQMRQSKTDERLIASSAAQHLPSLTETWSKIPELEQIDDKDVSSSIGPLSNTGSSLSSDPFSCGPKPSPKQAKSKIPVPARKYTTNMSQKTNTAVQIIPSDSSSSQEVSSSSNSLPPRWKKVTPRPKSANRKRVVRGQRYSSPIKGSSDLSPAAPQSSHHQRKLFTDDAKENKSTQVPTPVTVTSHLQPRSPLHSKSSNTVAEAGRSDQIVSAVPKHSCSMSIFPVQSDRDVITFLSVSVGSTEEQVVTLRNSTSRDVSLNVMIRDSPAFKLGVTNVVKVHINAQETKTVNVYFHPTKEELVVGKLVLKPLRVTAPDGRAMKATIPLQGLGGAPDIRLCGLGEIDQGKRVLNFGRVKVNAPLMWTVELANHGPAPAFYKFQGYNDVQCRQPDPNLITFDPMFGIIKAKTLIAVQVTIDPRMLNKRPSSHDVFGSIALFYGPEICRQVYQKARLLPGAPRLSSSPSLLCTDFTHAFSQYHIEGATFCGKIVEEDVKHFYEKTQKEVIQLVGCLESEPQFKSLVAEETLSATRINCTVTGQQASEHLESMAPQESAAQSSTETQSSARRPKEVHLECNITIFPSVMVGEKSLTKVKIRNPTTQKYHFRIGMLMPPFSTKYKEINVQPRSYASLPVFFSPTTRGSHQATLCFRGVGFDLQCLMQGNTSD